MSRNWCTDSNNELVQNAALMQKKSPPKNVPVSYRNILVPVDFSPASARAVQHALALVGNEPARIFLLHVVSPQENENTPLHQVRARAEKQLREFVDHQDAGHDHAIHCLVRTGPPFQEIVAAAKENGAEMIVLASHESAPIRGVSLGHTIDRVSRYASCPVMIVRESE